MGRQVGRRRAPRPAAEAIRSARERVAPQTTLAAIQTVWEDALGAEVAAHARPVAERGGEVTVECADAVWAQELDLMQAQLLERLGARLGDRAPTSLRFRAG